MSADDDSGKLPLVSADVFNALQVDLDDAEAARRYLLSNLQMWEGRYTRLSVAIKAGNNEAAMDAVLSVRTSAGMVAALRLAQLAAGIQQYLVAGNTLGPEGTDGERQNAQNLDRGPGVGGWLRRADSLLAGLAIFARWESRLN